MGYNRACRCVSVSGVSQPVQQQMPTGQGQTAAVDETRVKPGTADGSNALGGSEAGQPEVPVTSEQELPTGSTATDAGGAGEKSDVNLPGN
jgi:hypothetical protein